MKGQRWKNVGICLVAMGLGLAVAQAPVKVSFWHSMGGVNGEAVDRMVKAYNATQNACLVEATYVGSYDDGLTKLQAALRGKNPPHIQQIYDLGLQAMAESGQIIPVSELARKTSTTSRGSSSHWPATTTSTASTTASLSTPPPRSFTTTWTRSRLPGSPAPPRPLRNSWTMPVS